MIKNKKTLSATPDVLKVEETTGTETACKGVCENKVINKLDITFPNVDLNKLVEKLNEVIDKVNGN